MEGPLQSANTIAGGQFRDTPKTLDHPLHCLTVENAGYVMRNGTGDRTLPERREISEYCHSQFTANRGERVSVEE